MDLKNINQIEQAIEPSQRELLRLGVGFLFLIMILLFAGNSWGWIFTRIPENELR